MELESKINDELR
ncbi:BnaA03g54020D [Brassica napus]|uniref:BnaA03g54020D protein n=3 Tax=Brassica TaxID=3705 RepID=A0A078GWL9_BRANA|nr:BnaA03g54020D [Brassica napus]